MRRYVELVRSEDYGPFILSHLVVSVSGRMYFSD